jgi:hypothetical protein
MDEASRRGQAQGVEKNHEKEAASLIFFFTK